MIQHLADCLPVRRVEHGCIGANDSFQPGSAKTKIDSVSGKPGWWRAAQMLAPFQCLSAQPKVEATNPMTDAAWQERSKQPNTENLRYEAGAGEPGQQVRARLSST